MVNVLERLINVNSLGNIVERLINARLMLFENRKGHVQNQQHQSRKEILSTMDTSWDSIQNVVNEDNEECG